MRSSLILIVVVLSAGLLANARAAERRPDVMLVLKEKAVVRGPEILLGDLTGLPAPEDTGLAGLSLGPSPMPGETRIVTRTEVHRLLESESLPGVGVSGAAQVCVSRSSRPLPEAEVSPVLKAHVAAVTGWQPDEVEIRAVRNLKEIEIPAGAATTLRFLHRSAPLTFRNLQLPLEVSVDGMPFRTVWITADIRITATVAQASRRLPYGAVLAGDDVREVRVEIPDPRIPYVRSAGAAAGKSLRRALKPGELITGDALSDPLIVRSGDTVHLRFEKPNIRAVMLARAEQNGRMGQSIRIRNLEFDRTLKALVVGPGEVLVQ